MSSLQLDKHIMQYVSNWLAELEGMQSKFADDTKWGGAVDSLEFWEALQRDLNKLEGWGITNCMKFNRMPHSASGMGWRVHTALSTCRSISSAVRMNLPILTAVLLGLVLTPALADYSQQTDNNCQVSVGGVFQNLTLSSQTRIVVIEQRSDHFSWKTIWNYNTGIIATKLMQERTCYISVMNRNEMPSFKNLAQLASQNMNQIGLGRPTKKITFVTNGLVNNLNSYGIDITAMCSGLTTYMAYEVHRPQVNLGSCIALNVLRVVELDYCNSNGNWNGTGNGNWNGNLPSQQIPGGIVNNTQVIVGGQSQIVTINRQWHVAVIEKNTVSVSWKTIWNYNTRVFSDPKA
ncbi:gastrokine-1-like [Chamaea fasciata]|uniref:gastrokine-1-like n=1 Tax=Chamaea fasciata TaxID=190680 RepID=UPI00336A2B7E